MRKCFKVKLNHKNVIFEYTEIEQENLVICLELE